MNDVPFAMTVSVAEAVLPVPLLAVTALVVFV
jgi:hypothetical protein